MAQAVSATPAQAQELQRQAAAFQQYAGRVSAAVARRYAFFRTLAEDAARNSVSLSDALPASLITANDTATRNAVRWATAVVALDRRTAELAAWTPDNGATIKLGVVVAGSIPRSLSAWPIIPILYYGAGAIAAVGVWLLGDAWLDARNIEAEAVRVHAETQAAVTAAIAKASAVNPAYGQMVADSIAKANAATKAPPQGVLASLAESIATATEAGASMVKAGGGLGGFALLLAALYLGSRGERGRA